jgi:hypothetical protein
MSEARSLGRPRWWQWITVLSLDAPLVALVWQSFFARVLQVELAWHQGWLLGMAVWVVYAADRWIEGWRLTPGMVQTHRHDFSIRWRWPLLGAGLVVIGISLEVALAHMQRIEWVGSLILLAATLVYLFSHQGLHRQLPGKVPKELCVAILFPLGTSLFPAIQLISIPGTGHSPLEAWTSDRMQALWVPLGCFALLCLANLMLISVWEAEVDIQHGQTSLALQCSEKQHWIHLFPRMLVILGLPAVFFAEGHDRTAMTCFTLSAFFLALLDCVEPRIGRELSRSLIDLMLLPPAFCFLGR